MRNIYYVLLFLLLFISVTAVVILAIRADQADKFFEYQRSQEVKNYEED